MASTYDPKISKEKASELMKRYGTQRLAAKYGGVSRASLRRALYRGSDRKKPTDTISRKTKTLAAFRSEHDIDFIVPDKIKKGIKDLGPGGWEYEVDFSRWSGIKLSDLAAYRDQFSDYWVQLRKDGRRAWAGSKQLAAAMRKMV
jgi:hypothetical protein